MEILQRCNTLIRRGVAELGDEPLATGSEPPYNMLRNHPAIQRHLRRQSCQISTDSS